MSHVLLAGDCREQLALLDADCIDACVTDPPYELGFMGKGWDKAGVSFDPATWAAVLRVMKPGAHLVAFGGTRTFHRIACAIEDAGFEIRDCLSWLYGSGFPKSLNVSKAIDAAAGAEREVIGSRVKAGDIKGGRMHATSNEIGVRTTIEYTAPATPEAAQWDGWGTALKPAWEPIILARKPLVGTVAANVLALGTGALNVDGTRVAGEVPKTTQGKSEHTYGGGAGFAPEGLQESNPSPLGRWPANVVLDEAAAALLDEQSGIRKSGIAVQRNGGGGKIWDRSKGYADAPRPDAGYSDSGGASRFFYCAKASAKEREAGLDHLPIKSAAELTGRKPDSAGLKNPRASTTSARANVHPTVKPLALMQWLVRLVTPPGGLVLDPFTGSGTTGCAAVLEGFHFLGIELTAEYVPIAEARICHSASARNSAT